ncbi:hypothetical protein yaldo0001_23200 [Yersinia aldovae ATCC 35236]|uniref:Uncharacterized protein n=1 Tax=Yersinia aldovae TaxID=29483 RepID=A0A0T9SXW2_YERAL|nr:hypothetical protein [Yersinia aldovae]EEP94887.1 hypothetical protein yaldo0001_23200 [Yersinia aldovae ATCC 35236]CNK47051.1 Uncharacterised protein [Yersinia aldovae]
MKIEEIVLIKSAQFYKVNKVITKKTINSMFDELSEFKIGRYLLKECKIDGVTNAVEFKYSIAVYKVETEPSFIHNSSLREVKFSYVLLLEIDDSLVIFKKNIDSPEKKLSKYISEYDYEYFCHFGGGLNPEYERVSMSNMSISDAVIRSRTLEAYKLNGIIPLNSASRSVPKNFRVKIDNGIYSLCPNSSRVTLRDKAVGIYPLVVWASETILEIKNTLSRSDFLDNFATPIVLEDIILKGGYIASVFFDFNELDKQIRGNNPIYKLMIDNGVGELIDLDDKKLKRFFNAFKSPILVLNNKLKIKGKMLKGSIIPNKKTITIKVDLFNKFVIVDGNNQEITIGSYINKYKPFLATFNSPNYICYSRSCFEDRKILNNLKSVINILDDSYDFSSVISEKCKPHGNNITEFPEKSLFYHVEKMYISNNSILICDDMNDEWADHIHIECDNNPSISFIHSKYTKKDSYGASKFHEVVSQALKNIGMMYGDIESIENKYTQKWSKNYEETNITRVRGNKKLDDVKKAFNSISSNPNTVRKIVLATPFIRRKEVESIFENIERNGHGEAYHIQLIWLISTFVSACQEYGIQPKILCKK